MTENWHETEAGVRARFIDEAARQGVDREHLESLLSPPPRPLDNFTLSVRLLVGAIPIGARAAADEVGEDLLAKYRVALDRIAELETEVAKLKVELSDPYY